MKSEGIRGTGRVALLGEQKYTQSFGRETSKKETNWRSLGVMVE
jgi:hypothetical protein